MALFIARSVLGSPPFYLEPVRAEDTALEIGEGGDDPMGLRQAIVRVGATDCEDGHSGGASSSDPGGRVLEDDARGGFATKSRRRAEVALWIGLPLADIRSRDENGWVRYVPQPKAQAGDGRTSGRDHGPACSRDDGKKLTRTGYHGHTPMLGLFQLVEDGDLDGDVQVWRYLAQRFTGAATVRDSNDGGWIEVVPPGPLLPDEFDAPPRVDQDAVEVEEDRLAPNGSDTGISRVVGAPALHDVRLARKPHLVRRHEAKLFVERPRIGGSV